MADNTGTAEKVIMTLIVLYSIVGTVMVFRLPEGIDIYKESTGMILYLGSVFTTGIISMVYLIYVLVNTVLETVKALWN